MAEKEYAAGLPPRDAPADRAETILHIVAGERATPSSGELLSATRPIRIQGLQLPAMTHPVDRVESSRNHAAELYALAPVGLLTLDAKGRIQEANPAATATLGIEHGKLIDSELLDFVDVEHRLSFETHRQLVLSSGVKQACLVRMIRGDGSRFQCRLESVAGRGEVASSPECYTALIDVSGTESPQHISQDSDRRYRRLLEAVTDYVYRVRVKDGLVVETIHGANCEAVTGYTPEDFARNPMLWIAMVPPEDRHAVEEQAARVLRGQESTSVEHRICRKDGTLRWVQNTAVSQFDENGTLLAYDGLLRDITERRQVQDELRDHQRRLEAIFDNSFQFIGLLSPDGTLLQANRSALELIDATEEQVVGKLFWETAWWTHSSECQRRLRVAIDRANRGQFDRFEATHETCTGVLVHIDFSLSPVKDPNGNVVLLVPEGRDITERKRTEEAVRRLNSELELRVTERTAELERRVEEATMLAAAIQNLGEGVMITEDELDWPGPRIVFVNEAMCRITGFGCDELIGQSPRRLQGKATDRNKMSRVRRELNTGKSVRCEIVNYRKDGSPYHAELFIAPLFAPDGRRTHFVSIHRDVSDRRRTQRKLRKSEERFRLFMDNSPTIAWMKDEQGRFVYLSKPFEKCFGARLAAWRGKTDFDAWPVEFAQVFRDNDMSVLSSGNVLETIEETPGPDGTRSSWWVFKFPFEDAAGRRYVGGMAADITGKKQAEAALRESQNRILGIMNAATDAIITIEQGGRIVAINPATERMFGYAASGLIGKYLSILLPSLFADEDDEAAPARDPEQHKISRTSREAVARRQDGSMFPVDLVISEVEHLQLFTGIIRDISERKELQLQLLQIADEEHRRLGQDLHDDVGQELTALVMMAETLVEELREETWPDAELAQKMRDRLKTCLHHVRMLSRGLVPVEIDCEGLMSALQRLAEQVGELNGVFCRFRCPRRVAIEDSQAANHLYHIAQEALTNAIKHGHASSIEVSLHATGGRVTLSIRDNGTGIPKILPDERGIGLKIMHYRASLIGASLSIRPLEKGGTLVTCRLVQHNSREAIRFAE